MDRTRLRGFIDPCYICIRSLIDGAFSKYGYFNKFYYSSHLNQLYEDGLTPEEYAEKMTKCYAVRADMVFKQLHEDTEFSDLVSDLANGINSEDVYGLMDEIEECLSGERERVLAYIKDVIRWINSIADCITFEDNYFYGFDYGKQTLKSKMLSELENQYINDYNDDEYLISVFLLIRAAHHLIGYFEMKCKDFGFDLPQIIGEMDDVLMLNVNQYGLSNDGAVTDETPKKIEPKQDKLSDFKLLQKYIKGSPESIAYMLKYGQPKDDIKMGWKGERIGDALLLNEIVNITVADINRCLEFKGKTGKLTAGNKVKNENQELSKILGDIKKKISTINL